jgi:hypothetical protein
MREQHALLQGELLINRNPRAILRDQEVEPVPPVEVRVSLLERLRTLFERESS